MKRPASPNAIDYSVLALPKRATVRKSGYELEKLRMDCLKRDKSKCQECGDAVSDNFPAWHPKKYHMHHVKSRGAGGSDELSNLKTLCGECHREIHAKGVKG